MNWYIGQEIVAIKGHSNGAFKIGDEFVIEALQKGCCGEAIHIGVYVNGIPCHCAKCGRLLNGEFYSASKFAPKQTQFKEITYTKIKEELNVPQSVN